MAGIRFFSQSRCPWCWSSRDRGDKLFLSLALLAFVSSLFSSHFFWKKWTGKMDLHSYVV